MSDEMNNKTTLTKPEQKIQYGKNTKTSRLHLVFYSENAIIFEENFINEKPL